MFAKRFRDKLKVQKETGLYRNPPEVEKRVGKYLYVKGEKILNFASNDYLGLGVSKELSHRVAKNFEKYGASSSSSRLVSGNYSVIGEAEKEYAKYFGYDEALFFPSGYQANLGVISTFFDKGDTVFFDKHIHASSVKGMSLSGADFKGFKHNNMDHLKKRLKKHDAPDQAAILTEALFSMDGTFLDLENFKKLKQEYGFLSLVDEAHSFGVVGDSKGLARQVADIAVGTFGKSFGLFGAFALMPEGFREYLVNFSSPVIYTTTLPEAHAASTLDALEIIANSKDQRTHLENTSSYMRQELKKAGFSSRGEAHIISVEIGDEKKSVVIGKELFEKGIFAFPARYPTVPEGQAIIRVGMTALHDENDVDFFIKKLKEVHNELS